ncbi:MAG TPA: PKD domain-containing protein, partial [Anaerolineales bacterium]|nr:PKD domain-containing protein [Anaerolineales bacterium]
MYQKRLFAILIVVCIAFSMVFGVWTAARAMGTETLIKENVQSKHTLSEPSIPSFASEIEPNGTLTDAMALQVPGPIQVTGNITPPGDVDFYALDVVSNSLIFAAVRTGESTTSPDSMLRVISPNSTTLELDDDDGDAGLGSDLSSVIAGFPVTETNTYYLRVNEYADDDPLSPYQLFAQVHLLSDMLTETEPNNGYTQTMPLQSGDLISGTSATLGDADWYAISLEKDETLFAALDGAPFRAPISYTNYMLSLYAPNGATLLWDANGSTTGDSFNPPAEGGTYQASVAGVYFLRVVITSGGGGGEGRPTVDAGEAGDYLLSVGVFPVAPPRLALLDATNDSPTYFGNPTTLTATAYMTESVPALFEDFESGSDGWASTSLWHVESETDTCGALQSPFPSSSHAMYFGTSQCTYSTTTPVSGTLDFTSPISLPFGTPSSLSFWTYEETECSGGGNGGLYRPGEAVCGYDYRYVMVSTNNITWTTVYSGGQEGIWNPVSIDLSPFQGRAIYLRFQFDSGDATANDYFGWMVDNIEIQTNEFIILPVPPEFVTYTWEFGDGSSGAGQVLTHTYAPGVYNAVATASNATNAISATTTVIVIDNRPPQLVALDATNDSPTQYGNTTTLTATAYITENLPYLVEDFETGTDGWTSTSLWHLEDETSACGSLINPFISSSHAMYFGNATCTFSETTSVSGTLNYIAPITLGVGVSPVLSFWTYEETECGNGGGGGNSPDSYCGYDARLVQVSTDQLTWTTLYYGGIEGIWNPVSLNLSAFEGQTIYLRFSFDSEDNVANEFLGWMLDDIEIRTQEVITIPAPSAFVSYTWAYGDGANGAGQVSTHAYTPGVYDAVVTGFNSTNALTATTVVTVFQNLADLTLAKLAPASVYVGNDFTYTLVITNNGLDTALSPLVTDTLPAEVTFVSASAGCTETSGTVVCSLSDLASGSTGQATITVNAALPGTATNTAVVASPVVDPNPQNNFAQVSTDILQNGAPTLSELAITSPINENDFATLTGQFTDPDQADSFEVWVDWGNGVTQTLTLPAGSTTFSLTQQYLDDDPTQTSSDPYTVAIALTDSAAHTVTGTVGLTVNNVAPWLNMSFPDLDVDENTPLTVIGNITDPGTADTFTFIADWADGSVTTTTLPAGTTVFTVTHLYLDDDPTGTPEDAYFPTFTLWDDDLGEDSLIPEMPVTIHNLAPTADAGADQTGNDALPVSFSGTFTDPGPLDTHAILWSFGDGLTATGTLTPTHTFPGVGTYTVTLTVTDDDTGTDSDTLLVTILPSADLALSQQAGPDPVLSGASIFYTLTVTNLGPSDATDVVLTDPLPAGTSFAGASAGCTETAGEVTCTLPVVENGASVTVHITVTVPVEVVGLLTNTATVSHPTDPNLANNTA